MVQRFARGKKSTSWYKSLLNKITIYKNTMIEEDLLKRYKNLNWSSLLRKDLGNYSLVDAKPTLNRIKKFFDSILLNPALPNLAQSIQNEIQSQLIDFLNYCDNTIKTFSDIGQKEQQLEEIRNREHQIINALGKYSYYFSEIDPAKGVEFKKYSEEAKEKVEELNRKIKEVDEITKHAKKQAQEKEVAQFGIFFSEEAIKNKLIARIALGITGLFVFLTIFLAYKFLAGIEFNQDKELSFWENIFQIIHSQSIIFKIIIISLGGYLISLSSKIHSAEKHLYTLNTQRQNALNSHRQILKSVQATESQNDLETMNKILTQVTKAIFENQDSGYLKNPSNPIHQFLNFKK